MQRIRFRPKKNIIRCVNGRDVIVFRTTYEYDGEMFTEGRAIVIIAEDIKHNKMFKLKKHEVDIL